MKRLKTALAVSVFSCAFAATAGHAELSFLDAGQLKGEYAGFEHADLDTAAVNNDGLGASPVMNGGGGGSSRVFLGFEGMSQYTVAAFRRGFVPPDTMGAVGTSQYVSFVNGGYGVWDKNTGAVQSIKSDLAFWAEAGQDGANGDSRVLYNAAANRWIAISFGDSVSDIQIAVSDTSNALGTWQSTKFTGFADGTADYPTLAMDTHALYIGTNNFGEPDADGISFKGTTLNVIPLTSILAAGGPTVDNKQAFTTAYTCGVSCTFKQALDQDGGYAIQGVNSTQASPNGTVLSSSLFFTNLVMSDVTNAGSGASTRTANTYLGNAVYQGNDFGRQPNKDPDVNLLLPGDPNYHPSNDRVVDTLDDRISSSVYEVNGLIYAVHTVTPVGGDHTVIRWSLIDAATKTLVSEGDIGDAEHDFYQASLAVNDRGQVVIAYNRSGSGEDGKITFAALVFSTNNGTLIQRGDEEVLKVSLVDDYHNNVTLNGAPCGLDGQVACGRQRWGDYSAVSLDPNDPTKFYVIGEFAREYNDASGGHVGSGGSRWGTYIAGISTAGTSVPEPASWAMMIAGFALAGTAARRARRTKVAFA